MKVVQRVTPPAPNSHSSDAPSIDRVSTDGLPSWIAEDNSRVVCLQTPQYATSSLPSLTAECATRLHRPLLRSPGFLSSSGLGRSIPSTAALPEYEFPFVGDAECSTMELYGYLRALHSEPIQLTCWMQRGSPTAYQLILLRARHCSCNRLWRSWDRKNTHDDGQPRRRRVGGSMRSRDFQPAVESTNATWGQVSGLCDCD